MNLLDRVATVVGFFAYIGLGVLDVAFIVVMHVWVDWRRNEWGRNVVIFSYMMAAIVWSSFLPDYPGRRAVMAALLAGLAVVMTQRLWLTVRRSVLDRKERNRRERNRTPQRSPR